MYTNNKNIVIGDNYKATFKTEADAAAFVANANTEILNRAKQAKIKQLHDKYQKMYDIYLSQYPKREVDSFAVKQAEAIAYNLDNSAATPVIDAIIASSNISKEDYIASVLDKVTTLAKQEGQMVKIRNKIKACKTLEDLNAIKIENFEI